MGRVDWDEYDRQEKARQRRNMGKFEDSFNEAMRQRGDGRTLADILGQGGGSGPHQSGPQADTTQLQQLVHDIIGLSTDDDIQTAVTRGLATYRRILQHAQTGGRVEFVSDDGTERKALKVRNRVTIKVDPG